jgi:Rap1a immunity proteins
MSSSNGASADQRAGELEPDLTYMQTLTPHPSGLRPHAEKRDGKLTGFWCVSAIVFCCLWSHASCAGEREIVSIGNDLLSSCKSVVGVGPHDAHREGRCVGEVAMLMELAYGKMLVVPICPAKGAFVNEGVRLVVAFLEANPQRLHEPFSTLAFEALLLAWPCKE